MLTKEMIINKNGAAFPVVDGTLTPGLTKREYIVTQLVAGILTNGKFPIDYDLVIKMADTIMEKCYDA